VGKKYFDEDGNPDEMVGVLLRAVWERHVRQQLQGTKNSNY
jgi:hypothetical protein